VSDTAINGVLQDEGGNNIYEGNLVNGVPEGHGTEYKTILVDGIQNVYRHYRGHFSMGLKNGKGEYRIFKKAGENEICLAILCAQTENGKIIYGECEVTIEPFGKVLYKGSYNDSFEMHGSGSIFNIGNQILNISPLNFLEADCSHVWTGFFFNGVMAPDRIRERLSSQKSSPMMLSPLHGEQTQSIGGCQSGRLLFNSC
jgi:hypothetical protein